MPSGFTNTQDQLTPTYYRVLVNSSGFSTTATNTNSGSVEVFDHNYFTTLNTTANNSIRRARGNLRWNAILTELQKFSNCEILDVTVQKAGPADQTAADDVAISVAFTVGYAQEEYVFSNWQKFLNGATLSDGATSLSTATYEGLSSANKATQVALCIREAVTRGITLGGSSGYTRRYRTSNPTLNEQRDINVTITQPDTPVNVWGVLTVGIIDSMTQEPF
jgi:hypothetical protein